MTCCAPEGFTPHPNADPDCILCGGDGYITNDDLLAPPAEESAFIPCECITTGGVRQIITPAVFTDEDKDGWLDTVPTVAAKYAGGRFQAPIIGIVLHNLAEGRGGAGPAYFHNPNDDRKVSAHFVVHWDGSVTQCVPLTRRAYHAGGLGNGWSIGLEHDAARGEPWSNELLLTHCQLVTTLRQLFPTINEILAHRYLYPRTRKDPLNWDWDKPAYIGLKVFK